MRRDESIDFTNSGLYKSVWNKSWMSDCSLLCSRALAGKACLSKWIPLEEARRTVIERITREYDRTHACDNEN